MPPARGRHWPVFNALSRREAPFSPPPPPLAATRSEFEGTQLGTHVRARPPLSPPPAWKSPEPHGPRGTAGGRWHHDDESGQ